ncbi:MAG TPA: HNH endonuclease family protein [Rubrobacteraceae bacterium]|nr:HNH endonuclease family protein [Rubrobacteraceae bacterium]
MKEGANGGKWIPSTMGKLLARIALVILVLAVTGCGLVELGSPEEDAGGSGTSQVSGPNEVLEALADLEVSDPGSMSGYSRESFKHWSRANDFGWDAPESSCDAREAALIRDGEDVMVGSGCKVTSGSWYDPYTNQTFTNPSDIDTDHVVPLANAYRSGASSWSNEERERYANDPDVLLSVEDNANQSKGDKGPEAWKPPNEAVWCDYAQRWVGIKDKYDMSINPEEKEALSQMLDGCAGG